MKRVNLKYLYFKEFLDKMERGAGFGPGSVSSTVAQVFLVCSFSLFYKREVSCKTIYGLRVILIAMLM